MDPITIGLLAGAVLGTLKGEQGKRQEKNDRMLNADITRYSPWTHMSPNPVQHADPTGNIMQGALGGAMLGQGIATTNAQNAWLASQQGAAAAPAGAAPTYVPGQGMPPYANAVPYGMQAQNPWAF